MEGFLGCLHSGGFMVQLQRRMLCKHTHTYTLFGCVMRSLPGKFRPFSGSFSVWACFCAQQDPRDASNCDGSHMSCAAFNRYFKASCANYQSEGDVWMRAIMPLLGKGRRHAPMPRAALGSGTHRRHAYSGGGVCLASRM